MPDYDNMSMDEIFKLDSSERLKALTQLILELEKRSDPALYDDAMREAHSLKAAARVVNNIEVQNLAHKIEEVLEAAKDEKKKLNSQYVDLFFESLDAMSEIAGAFLAKQTHQIDVKDLVSRMEDAKQGRFTDRKEKKETPDKNENALQSFPQGLEEKRQPKGRDSTEKRTGVEQVMVEKKASDPTVRVGIEKLDSIMNLSGEIYTNTLYLERERENLAGILAKLNMVLSGFDAIRMFPIEKEGASGRFQETVSKSYKGISSFQEAILSYSETINDLTVSFGHLSTQLQDEVMRSRMLPVSMIFEPHLRLVRDLSSKDGKIARLIIEGEHTLVDKAILEILKDPLTHLVRNACDHGIERPEERIKKGKSEEGTVTLSAYHKAGRVIIEIKDDGRGIDTQRLTEKIAEKQIMTEEKISKMSHEEILNFAFLPGLSTAESVTSISGRGIGLDVVKSNLSKIGGRVSLEKEWGNFTRFLLSLPLTLAVTKSLLVESGGETFCFPLTRVEEVATVKDNEIMTVEGRAALDIRGEIVSLVHLADLWGLNGKASSKNKQSQKNEGKPFVVIGQGRQKVALRIENMLGEKEIVTKSLDKRLRKVPDISGVCVLENGQVAFIVDIDSLLRSSSDYTGKSLISRAEEAEKIRRKRILVVEDSITVRELERKVLENNGYDAVTAVDGLEAWNKVRITPFDLIITDIEMPRMDGFEFISLLKKDKALCKIPTIIVSYKEREEDKRRGMEVGADKYLTKGQYENGLLLEEVAKLIG